MSTANDSSSDQLRAECSGPSLDGPPSASVHHGAAAGTLPLDKFRFFLEQDNFYLEEYARCLAMGAAKSRTEARTPLFHRRSEQVLDLELPSNRSLLAQRHRAPAPTSRRVPGDGARERRVHELPAGARRSRRPARDHGVAAAVLVELRRDRRGAPRADRRDAPRPTGDGSRTSRCRRTWRWSPPCAGISTRSWSKRRRPRHGGARSSRTSRRAHGWSGRSGRWRTRWSGGPTSAKLILGGDRRRAGGPRWPPPPSPHSLSSRQVVVRGDRGRVDRLSSRPLSNIQSPNVCQASRLKQPVSSPSGEVRSGSVSGTIAAISSSVYSVFASIVAIEPASSACAASSLRSSAVRNRRDGVRVCRVALQPLAVGDDDQLVVGGTPSSSIFTMTGASPVSDSMWMPSMLKYVPIAASTCFESSAGPGRTPRSRSSRRIPRGLRRADRLQDGVIERKSRDPDRRALDAVRSLHLRVRERHQRVSG